MVRSGKTTENSITSERGFTLIESILSLFVVSLMVMLLVGLVSVRGTNRGIAYRSQAAALADEEMNVLRRLDFATISNQNNGQFKNVLYSAGTWTIGTDSLDLGPGVTQHIAPGIIEIPAASGFAQDAVSGRLNFPAGTYGDVAFQAKWKVVSPATGWSVGYVLRARDNGNGYRLRVSDTTTDLDIGAIGIQNVLLEKLVDGAGTPLGSAAVTLSAGSWFLLKLSASGSSLSVDINASPNVITATDSTFATGPGALVTWYGANVRVDDTIITTTSSQTWDFENITALPAAWIRFGLNNLPDSTATVFDDNGLLTIESYPDASSTTLKKATITIKWVYQGTERSYTTTSLIGKSGLGL